MSLTELRSYAVGTGSGSDRVSIHATVALVRSKPGRDRSGTDVLVAQKPIREKHEKNPAGCSFDISVDVVISSCGDEARADAGKR